MDHELFALQKQYRNPFHPLDLAGCYEILDSMSIDELLAFGSDPADAYDIVNKAYTLWC